MQKLEYLGVFGKSNTSFKLIVFALYTSIDFLLFKIVDGVYLLFILYSDSQILLMFP